MPEADLQELLALAVSLAEEASALLRAGLDHAREVVDTKSSITDMVTATDRASEQVIVHGLRRARPDDAILGEEGTADGGTSGVRWVIDPLDGTTNYLYGLPAFAVSIAAEIDGRTVVGVVADASRGELFTAVRGAGAFLDGHRLRCGGGTDLAAALVGTGFSYDAARRGRQGAVVAAVLPVVRDIRRVGAAAIDLCWVACGRLDAYFERGLQPWDLAAGALVAAEAGARIGDLGGGPPSGAFVLAAPEGLFPPLHELLSTLHADQA
ncbi:MAG: inositol monophosphatase [Acidobacteria bacterium]|nr:inositol monophosphatase [Acidobacteriota bacterium]